MSDDLVTRVREALAGLEAQSRRPDPENDAIVLRTGVRLAFADLHAMCDEIERLTEVDRRWVELLRENKRLTEAIRTHRNEVDRPGNRIHDADHDLWDALEDTDE